MLFLLSAIVATTIHIAGDSNYCVDIPGGEFKNGKNVQLYECNGSPAQDFMLLETGETQPTPPTKVTTGPASLADPSTPAKDGYFLAFSDEFDGDTLDLTKWNLITDGSGGGNSENEYYLSFPANHQVAKGYLTIHAQKQSFLGQSWTSAKLTTMGRFDFLYGYVEARIKIPSGQGAWPAFWALPANNLYGQWPTSGELDIMEILGGDPGHLYTTVHYGPAWPNQKQLGKTTTATPGTDYSQDYHVYAMDWQQDHIDFLLDGTTVFTVKSTDAQWQTDAQGAAASTASGAWPFAERFYLILNMAVGGNWPGAPNPALSAFDMSVDYVRVYTAN